MPKLSRYSVSNDKVFFSGFFVGSPLDPLDDVWIEKLREECGHLWMNTSQLPFNFNHHAKEQSNTQRTSLGSPYFPFSTMCTIYFFCFYSFWTPPWFHISQRLTSLYSMKIIFCVVQFFFCLYFFLFGLFQTHTLLIWKCRSKFFIEVLLRITSEKLSLARHVRNICYAHALFSSNNKNNICNIDIRNGA